LPGRWRRGTCSKGISRSMAIMESAIKHI